MQPKTLDKNCERFCVTDVGSTTTKAFLFQRDSAAEGRAWRFVHREAPTTVEEPYEDVTVGVRAALTALEEASGERLLAGGQPAVPYLSTSSAGGGLAMVVTGLVREVTSRSAERVALGAGAILLDILAMDDGRTPYEKIEALRRLRPDMVLLAGGFDGEALSGPVFLAELIREAGLRPKLTAAGKLPVLFAGNVNARSYVADVLDERFFLHAIDNIRPQSNRENLEPAREAIHDLFMGHVMSQAPGYEKLLSWVSAPVRPTPSAFGDILALASRDLDQRILAIDIGGATTDVFTAERGEVTRTVSANLGMSYSILNVLQQAGSAVLIDTLRDHFGVDTIGEQELADLIGNKHLRPTSLPKEAREIHMELAVATLAIREAVREHLSILTGRTLSRSTSELSFQNSFEIETRFGRVTDSTDSPARVPKLKGYDQIIGSGGILSHSPRDRAAQMLIAALDPGPNVELALDRAFIFPHLGVLADVDAELALHLFDSLGVVRLGLAGEVGRHLGKEGPAAALDGDSNAASIGEGSDRITLDETAERISTRTFDERRELASPGQCLVSEGQQVRGDTVVARSIRTFQRPFFVRIAMGLGAKPDELPDCLLKKIGDNIEVGELIGKRRLRFKRIREYHSPVTGTFERLLPDGTMILREPEEFAADRVAVTAAQDIQLRPGELKAYLRVVEGQKVERDQTLASIGRPGLDLRASRAPVRGKITDINLDYGVITIDPLREELDVRAWIPGEVRATGDRGCTIRCTALRIVGCWGQGGEREGRLTLGEAGKDDIAVRAHVSRAELEALAASEVAGVIAGSAHLRDVGVVQPPFTLILTENFGDAEMSAEIRAALASHEGRQAYLDGTTELRVGVRRPRVIVPLHG